MEEIKEKLEQIQRAIEINESFDIDATNLYRLKHEYEDQLKELEKEQLHEEELLKTVEVPEMSPFRGPDESSIQSCFQIIKSKEEVADNYGLGNCPGCEHGCEYLRDYKGNILIHRPDLEVWLRCKV